MGVFTGFNADHPPFSPLHFFSRHYVSPFASGRKLARRSCMYHLVRRRVLGLGLGLEQVGRVEVVGGVDEVLLDGSGGDESVEDVD